MSHGKTVAVQNAISWSSENKKTTLLHPVDLQVALSLGKTSLLGK